MELLNRIFRSAFKTRLKSTALLAILLTGCTLNSTQKVDNAQQTGLPQSMLQAPKTLKHQSTHYQLKSQQDLGTIARYVYFEKKESSKNWKSALELLHDRQQPFRDLSQRIALREKVYKNNGVEHFKLIQQQDNLYAFVIYAPNEQQKNWQIEISRGAEVEGCGFVQYQYSLKIPQSAKLVAMGKVKLIGYLKKYAIDKEIAYLHQLKWDWHCRSQLNGKAQ